jgi:acetyltransferase-like isoleucine patch superfamily enzyme
MLIARSNRCSRERSPIPTRDQREAPPQVRPETEAHLAESLATHLQDVSNQAPTNGARVTENSQVAQDAPTNRYEESPVEGYSPGADPSDPHSKRKRNFSNRTKTGCHTCRTRKKKCDEAKPECNNCLRGGFTCTGYGPKPIESHKGSNANNRVQVPLQSKIQDAPQRSPAPLSSDGPRYDHWGRIPPTPTAQESHHRLPQAQSSHEIRHPHSRDVWRNSSWQYREPESPIYHNNTFPPPDYHQSMPPASTFDSRPAHDIWRHNIHSSHFPGPPANMSSHEASSAHSSRNPPFAPMQSSEVTEKHKMLIGEPYKAHIDGELLDDRRSCMAAVERWNQAHQHSRATSDEEKGRLFKAILDPSQRPDPNYQYRETSASLTRPGTIGSRVIIVSPFTCDYGYNIHIGDDSFLGANCTIEDAGDISIGNRVHIGKNVIFCGTDEPILRKGSQSELTAGAITIEDEVNIGAGTIIMPHRTIGKGASIAAGSVVTRVRRSIPFHSKSKTFPLLTFPLVEYPILHNRRGESVPSHQIAASP